MKWRSVLIAAAAAAAVLLPEVAVAQTSEATAPGPQTAVDRRAAQLAELLTGRISYWDFFDPYFQTAVPEPQFKAFSASLIAQWGQPIAVD